MQKRLGRLQPLMLGVFLVLVISACREKPHQALGILEWDRLSGRAPASEVITEIFVSEGQRVSRGDILLTIDDRKVRAQIEEVEVQIGQGKWRLQELIAGPREETIASARAKLDAARATLDNDRDIYNRQAALYKSKVVSQESLDTFKSRFLSSQQTVNALAESLAELLAGTRPEVIEQNRAQIEALKVQKKRLELLLEDYTIKATRDGIVDSLPYKVGDRPPAGGVVSIVLAGARPWARVAVPAPFRPKLKVGKEYKLMVDGYEQPFSARMRRISSEASFTPFYALSENDRNRLSYIAELDLNAETAGELAAGIPVQLVLEGL